MLLLIPGAAWLGTQGTRLSHCDQSVALRPLVHIPLERVMESNLSERFRVPDTVQWQKIARVWGEPEFVVTAIDETGTKVVCPAAIGLRIEIQNSEGHPRPLNPAAPPYGYSAACSESSVRFRAPLGDTLELAASLRRGRAPVRGHLIVVPDWRNTKDKLVGASLDDTIATVLEAAAVIGTLLIVVSAASLLRFARPKLP